MKNKETFFTNAERSLIAKFVLDTTSYRRNSERQSYDVGKCHQGSCLGSRNISVDPSLQSKPIHQAPPTHLFTPLCSELRWLKIWFTALQSGSEVTCDIDWSIICNALTRGVCISGHVYRHIQYIDFLSSFYDSIYLFYLLSRWFETLFVKEESLWF